MLVTIVVQHEEGQIVMIAFHEILHSSLKMVLELLHEGKILKLIMQISVKVQLPMDLVTHHVLLALRTPLGA